MIFSLQRRFLLLLLLPVALILAAVGLAGFFYAGAFVMSQRIDASRLKLEKAALAIERQLKDTTDLLEMIAKAQAVRDGHVTRAFLIQTLLQQKGVRFVDIRNWRDGEEGLGPEAGNSDLDGSEGRRLYTMDLCGDLVFCTPLMDRRAPDRALRIAKLLLGEDGKPAERLVVRIGFDSFIEPILKMDLWGRSDVALVTSTGEVLAHTQRSRLHGRRLGDTGNPLEKRVLSEIYRKAFGTVFGEGHPPDWVVGFHKVPSMNWYLILYSRGGEILEPMVRFRSYYATGGVAVLAVILLLIRFTTRSAAQSVRQISEAAAGVEQGDYTVKLPDDRSDELGELKRTFNRMIDGLKQRDVIQHTFGRYVDKKIADELMRSPEALNLGGRKRTVTIMMADIRNFTYIAEDLQPEEVIRILNEYFARMIAIIENYKGIIVDFYGDSILVFFDGVERDVASRAADAVKCALAMQKEQEAFAQKAKSKGMPEMHVGIGIHTGEVIVGNIGTETRAKYGIVGSNVNYAARIQVTASGGKIVISEKTYDTLGERVEVSGDFRVCLKGMSGDRQLYEVEALDREGAGIEKR